METITLLQHYWWLIISLLGALLVFLLFVQGGQGLLYSLGRTEEERNMLVNSLGRKWEFTFTTLVTFGGAFFASFPLFYSTSFGGAYYVWMTILLSFVIQPVAYQFRRKAGNVFGEKTFDVFLTINGIAGPLLLGTAVGTLFTGANFTVDRLNLANGAGSGSATVISQWTTPWHGLEALGDMRNVALGLAVMFLAGMLACQYFMNNIADETLFARARRRMLTLAAPFLVFFLTFFVWLLFSDGLAVDAAGRISAEPYKYLHNMLEMPYVAAALLIGTGCADTDNTPPDDGSLRLEVEQEVSRVTQGLITLTNGDQLVAPTTRKRLVKTTILLQDSQTAVIGGLLDDQKTYNQSEVPGLGSIPVLGWLFKSRNKKSTQTNLFIFITPKVIRNAADSADLTREKQLVLHETSVGHDGLGLPIMSKPKLLKPVFVN